jgi:putative acetyltransferase
MVTGLAPRSKEPSDVAGVLKFATIQRVTAEQCEDLVQESDLYLATLYPPASIYSVPTKDLEQEGNLLLGAFRAESNPGASPIGCVGFVRDTHEPDTAEIKRMFVSPGFRHLGVATQLMDSLEREAFEAGVTCLRLETGVHQHESMGLYFTRNYLQRGPYGDYPDDPYSVFLEKLLV